MEENKSGKWIAVGVAAAMSAFAGTVLVTKMISKKLVKLIDQKILEKNPVQKEPLKTRTTIVLEQDIKKQEQEVCISDQTLQKEAVDVAEDKKVQADFIEENLLETEAHGEIDEQKPNLNVNDSEVDAVDIVETNFFDTKPVEATTLEKLDEKKTAELKDEAIFLPYIPGKIDEDNADAVDSVVHPIDKVSTSRKTKDYGDNIISDEEDNDLLKSVANKFSVNPKRLLSLSSTGGKGLVFEFSDENIRDEKTLINVFSVNPNTGEPISPSEEEKNSALEMGSMFLTKKAEFKDFLGKN